MRKILRPLTLIGIVLLIPIVPFLLAGWWLEPSIEQTVGQWMNGLSGCLVTITLLASDIFLPVPSSVVCTVAGKQLGVLLGTGCAWLGMTLGSAIGFHLASRFGRPFATRFSSSDSLGQMDGWYRRFGTWFLILTRPLPILAEAAVLLCGLHRLPAHMFYPPVLMCNLGLSVAYAVLGEISGKQEWFPVAVMLAACLPLLLSWLVASRVTRQPTQE